VAWGADGVALCGGVGELVSRVAGCMRSYLHGADAGAVASGLISWTMVVLVA
jgi:hypothetical protein